MMNRTDELFAAITREVEAHERAFAAAEQLQRRREQIALELVRVEARREAERAEIMRRAGEDRAAIERERAAKIAHIERRYHRAQTAAIAERDALAAQQARTAAADQRADADAAASLDLERLHVALDRQSRALDGHYAQRIAALIDSTRREETALTTAAERAERARLTVAQIGGAWREQHETTHQSVLFNILHFGLSIAESRFQQFVAALVAAIPSALPPAPASHGGGVQMMIHAASPGAIRREVDSRLSEYFRRAGYTED